MRNEILIALVGLVVSTVTALVTHWLSRKKYTVETQKTELENVREGNDILMKQIVNPLKLELKSVRNELRRFRRAIEKIPACPHATDCPVSLELLAAEADDDDGAEHGK